MKSLEKRVLTKISRLERGWREVHREQLRDILGGQFKEFGTGGACSTHKGDEFVEYLMGERPGRRWGNRSIKM
jgi:hypothetical protein